MRSIRREAEADGSAKLLSIDLSGVSVVIAMPVHRDIPPQTVMSLLETIRVSREHGIATSVLFEVGVSDVELARSFCVYRFLNHFNEGKIFWIDSDMEWSPNAFMQMLALSTKVDVVCGVYSRKKEPLEFLIGTPGSVTMNEYGCIPCTTGGLGFTVMDRKVMQSMSDNACKMKLNEGQLQGIIPNIFHKGETEDGYLLTEDTAFFKDLRDAGFDIWCDPHIKLGHIGPKVYEGALIDHMVQKVAAE